MNTWAFSGNIGKDAVVRKTTNSTVCSFNVAVSSGFGDNKKTTWATCNLWGKRAEGKLPEYLKQGQQVMITGELTLEKRDHEGKIYTDLKVDVSTIDFGKPPQNQQVINNTVGAETSVVPLSSPNEDIPF